MESLAYVKALLSQVIMRQFLVQQSHYVTSRCATNCCAIISYVTNYYATSRCATRMLYNRNKKRANFGSKSIDGF